MSPAEAIATLQALRYISAMTAAHIKGKDGKTANKEVEAIQEGISVLRRQIPQKPVTDYEHSYSTWHCPSCGEGDLYSENYCPNCGQALDWSGGEDDGQ